MQSLFRNEAVPFRVQEAPGRRLRAAHQVPPAARRGAGRRAGRAGPAWLLFGLSTLLDEPPTARGGSPLDHPVFEASSGDPRASAHPDAPAGPYFLPWTATDSRFFRAAGIPSYGFSPFLIMNTDTLQVDRANERFALPAFVEGVDVYTRAGAPPGSTLRHFVLIPGNGVKFCRDGICTPLETKELRDEPWHRSCFIAAPTRLADDPEDSHSKPQGEETHNMLSKIRNRQKGFTLIELLIVVAIIGIIAALLIPNFLDALQKAKQKRTVADMRNAGTGDVLVADRPGRRGRRRRGQHRGRPGQLRHGQDRPSRY